MLLGEWDAAARHLDAAEAIARAEGLTPELNRVLRARAALVLACGGRGAAHAAAVLRSQAADIARQLRLTQLPAADLGTEALPSVLRPASVSSLGLSPRETDVLRLAAAGLSSRRIGEQLALSPHTVAKHLTSIFAKLGVDNRAAATAFAIRNGLG